MLEGGAFTRFAEIAEQIKAAPRRLEKAALLANYFISLHDDELMYAARYFAGHILPRYDRRTPQVNGATLLKALVTLTGVEPAILQADLGTMSDLGDVAYTYFRNDQSSLLGLEDVAIALEQLAVTRGATRKLEWLVKLLQKATPLEAKYLFKLLTGNLRLGLGESIVEAAIARSYRHPTKQVHWANLLLGDVGETALLAKHDELHTARMRLFHPIKFMLASPVTDLDALPLQLPEVFVVEDKYDGIRAQAHIALDPDTDTWLYGTVHDGVRVALFSRTLTEITASFPDLVLPLSLLNARVADGNTGLILDGEIVPMQGDRILSCQKLQQRLGVTPLTDELLETVPVVFIAYDLLYVNRKVLLNKAYTLRRAALETLNFHGQAVQLAIAQQLDDPNLLEEEFIAARSRGTEGLMIKNPASPYRAGQRGQEWLKIKQAVAMLDVVVTAVESGTGRRHHLLADYTFAVRASDTDSTLLNVGKANTGLSEAELAELAEWFREHTLEEFAQGQVRLVEPQIVLEVTFNGVQLSRRHQSGYALRFPRIVRLRTDKSVAEIDTLATVKQFSRDTEWHMESEG